MTPILFSIGIYEIPKESQKRASKNKFLNFIKKLLTCIFNYDVMYLNLKLIRRMYISVLPLFGSKKIGT